MPLSRTSTLPENLNAATDMLNEILAKDDTTVQVIIGDSQAIMDAIPLADYNAKNPSPFYERWVVWAKDRDAMAGLISPLLVGASGNNSDLDYDDINCFSLSPESRKATGIYHKNTELTDYRLMSSTDYAEALDAN